MEAGRVLGGRYRILEQIGGGGSAVVWRGYDQVLNRQVAIKVLSGPSATGQQARDRIHDEARMAAALSHPHIAQIHDVGESVDDGQETPYVVMELVDGPTVEQVGPLTVAQVLRLGAEVASALAAAHAIGLVHRDIKPANIIITASGAKVVDFGIAAPARVGGAAEPGSQLLGTPAYVAPERLTHDGVEPASDVYSLGVLLYRLLAGHLPWTAESTEQMLTDQVYVAPAPLPARPGLASAVVDLCTSCLAKKPADRPPAAVVAHALAAAAAQPTSGTPDAPAGRAPRSRRRLLLAVAVAVAAVVALVAWQAAPTGPADVAQGESQPPSAQSPVPGAGAGPSAPGASPTGSTAPTGRLPTAPDAVGPSATAPAPVVVPGLPGSPPPLMPTPGVPTPAPPPPPAPPQPQPSRFTSEAGTVTAVCTRTDLAELLSWRPTRPYTLDEVDPGPATEAAATFRRGTDIVRMTVVCTDGTPSHTAIRTTEKPAAPAAKA